MSFSLPKIPKSIAICGAALCAGVVLLLQNADSSAHWLKEQLSSMALHSLSKEAPGMLQKLGNMTGLEWLDCEEKALADDAAHEFEMTLARGEEGDAAEPEVETTVVPEAEQDDLEDLLNERLAELATAVKETDTPPDPPENATPPPPAKVEISRLTLNMPARSFPFKHWSNEREARAMSASALPGTMSMADVLECVVVDPFGTRTESSQGASRELRQTEEVAEVQREDTHQQEKPLPESRRMTQTAPAEGGEARDEQQKNETLPRLTNETPKQAHQETPEGKPEAAPAVRESAPPPSLGLPPPMRYHIQMVGDSMMQGLGPIMHSSMRGYKGVEFYLNARVSTGLCRPDYFNWPAQLREALQRHKTDLVIIFFGANDRMPIVTEGGVVPFGGPRWREAYAAKMAEMVEIVRAAGADLIWIQMPALGPQRYRNAHEIQIVQRDFCEGNSIPTLCTDDFFSGTWGVFEPYGDFHGKYVRLRAKDTAHLTRDGNLKLIENLMPIVHEFMTRFCEAHPECRLSAEEAAHIRKVPTVVVDAYVPYKGKKKK